MSAYQIPPLVMPVAEGVYPYHCPQTLTYLHGCCHEYDPGESPDGYDARFRFLLMDMGRGEQRRRIELVFVPHQLNCLWMAFEVNGTTVRGIPARYANVMHLARRVQEMLTNLYRASYDVGEDVLVISTVEDEDGLHAQRKWVMEKFFKLVPLRDMENAETQEVVPIGSDPERPLYEFIPLTLIGPGNLWEPFELDEEGTVVFPENHAA